MTVTLRVLDLFSGIGGFSLGLERAGMRTVAFCEIEPFCRAVLNKHWPNVPVYEDVRTLNADALQRDGIAVDVICGGFPCQDISFAGRGAGLAGERSGLWREYARLVGELRPQFVIVENVSALLSRGLGDVLGDLAALGYDAEWHCIPASAVGAPHRRDRIWIMAYAASKRRGEARKFRLIKSSEWVGWSGATVADSDSSDEHRWSGNVQMGWLGSACETAINDDARGIEWRSEPDVGRVVARVSSWLDGDRIENADTSKGGTAEILRVLQHADGKASVQWTSRGFVGLQAAEILFAQVCEYTGTAKPLGNVSLAGSHTSQVTLRSLWFDGSIACPSCRRAAAEQRAVEHPDAMRLVSQLLACNCRSAWLHRTGSTGTVRRVDRLRSLGNAVVPQIPEMIGRAILESIR